MSENDSTAASPLISLLDHHSRDTSHNMEVLIEHNNGSTRTCTTNSFDEYSMNMIFNLNGRSFLYSETMVKLAVIGALSNGYVSSHRWKRLLGWLILFCFIVIPVVWFKIYIGYLQTNLYLFVIFIAFQLVIVILCLEYLHNFKVDEFEVHFSKRTETGSAMGIFDVNVLIWFVTNAALSFTDYFYHGSRTTHIETFCYLLWNLTSTLPVAIAASAMTGSVILSSVQIERLLVNTVEMRLHGLNVKGIRDEYASLQSLMVRRGDPQAIYWTLLIFTAFAAGFFDIFRLYLQQSTISSVTCKSGMYVIFALELIFIMAMHNQQGRNAAIEITKLLLEIGASEGFEQISDAILLIGACA